MTYLGRICHYVFLGRNLPEFMEMVGNHAEQDYALRKPIDGKEFELGLTLLEGRGRRYPPVSICDLDFPDDIVLISNEI